MDYFVNSLLFLPFWALLIMVVITLFLPIISIIDCLFSDLSTYHKFIWLSIILFFPGFGLLAYFMIITPRNQPIIIKRQITIFR